jgi:hypothetical protein
MVSYFNEQLGTSIIDIHVQQYIDPLIHNRPINTNIQSNLHHVQHVHFVVES